MEHASQPVVRVDRRQHPDVMTAAAKLFRECLDMSENTARIRVGIGGYQTYAHTGNRSYYGRRTAVRGRLRV